MTNIMCGKELKLQNLLSLRKKMTQTEVNAEMMKIGKVLQEKNLKKNGPIITITFLIEQKDGQALMDMEILVPLDRKVELDGEYRFKEVFHIVNAVYASHEGNPALLQNTYNDLLAFIKENKLHQITGGYNVHVKDMSPGMIPDDMVIDVYIGVNPSIL